MATIGPGVWALINATSVPAKAPLLIVASFGARPVMGLKFKLMGNVVLSVSKQVGTRIWRLAKILTSADKFLGVFLAELESKHSKTAKYSLINMKYDRH